MRTVLKMLVPCAVLALTVGCTWVGQREIDEISRHIRSILELPTYEHVYRDVVYLDRERSFLIFKTMDTEVLFAVNVRIQAGIDLADGFSVRRRLGDGLIVQLPPAGILLADADEASIEQYFLKEIGGGISRLDYYDEISLKKDELTADAVERGILERANENARFLVQSFLENVRGETVTVVTGRGSLK